jgi:FtsP/CotA-like multicopper oxidase with cupredoxin domain
MSKQMRAPAGQPTLWFDEFVMVDDSTQSGGNSWVMPPDKYLPVGNATNAFFTIEYAAVGPGAADLDLYVQRTAAITQRNASFEDLNATAVSFGRDTGVVQLVFGSDGTTGDELPRGVLRLRLANASATPGNWGAVRLRTWVTLQSP